MPDDDDYHPSTVLVMLGPLHFEFAGKEDVLSVKVTTPEEMPTSLEKVSSMVDAGTVENLHVVLKSSSISSLFDERVLTTFADTLKPGAEASVHVLGSPDSPVQPADCDEIRVSMVMAGLRLEQEGTTEEDDGSWALKARKPAIETVDEESSKDAEDEENDETPAEES
mmetsp:Transcript_5179/g.11434  ORF Transcript_5179/g.11434 Transcript_5179/m.11434 type:complete len:168 (-) Transcript_5179:54-557(-)